eukprot:966540-Pyramimonas_sp.AAC.1
MEESGWWWVFSLDAHSLAQKTRKKPEGLLKNFHKICGQGPGTNLWILFGQSGSRSSILVFARQRHV